MIFKFFYYKLQPGNYLKFLKQNFLRVFFAMKPFEPRKGMIKERFGHKK